MVIMPEDIKLSGKKDVPFNGTGTEQADAPVATAQPDVKGELQEITSSTALVTQEKAPNVPGGLRKFIGDANLVNGKERWVFIQVKLGGNLMQYRVGSEQANLYIRQQAQKEGIYPTEKDIKEINQTLKAFAMVELKPVEVYLRVAPINDGVVIDLGDEDNTHVRITPGNVAVLDKGSDTLFYRTHLTLPMVKPSENGDFKKLKKYLRSIEDKFQILFFAWVSFTLAHPRVDTTNYVHLVLLGPQGSGKSFMCRMLGKLIDPNVVNLQTLPKNPKDFMVAAQNSHVLFYDNIRDIVKAIMDLMCGAATGTSSAVRQLYTDDGVSILFLHVAMVLNAIQDIITESDLVQRSLILNLQQMDEKERVSEKVLQAELENDLPDIMAGLFQLIADILKVLPEAKVTHPERMLDFSHWLAGYELVDGVEPGSYQALYSETLQDAQLASLLENDFASEVYRFAMNLEKSWKGTPTELFRSLSEVTSIGGYKRNSDWPKSVESMSKRLKNLLPALNTQGVFITFSKSRDRFIEINTTRIEEMY